ncbi:MAG: phosphopyruvate hydratase [Patescibacteria group bacterium]
MAKIKNIRAHKILDSRGEWTIETEISLDNGIISRASVPQGKSVGSFEAKSVLPDKAIESIEKTITPMLIGRSPEDQHEIDDLMISADNTPDKSNLGANSILGISLNCARTASLASNIPLWKYLASKFDLSANTNPKLFLNVINGGLHAGNNLRFQEYLIIPKGETLDDSVNIGVNVYQAVKKYLIKNLGASASNLGDEGGFAPNFPNELAPFEILEKVIKEEGLEEKIDFGIDAAANSIKSNSHELAPIYNEMKKRFNIYYLEDPYKENEFKNFSKIKGEIGETTIIAGDDLTTTNVIRMKKAKEQDCINGIIIKPNQIGTLSETIEAIKLAKEWGWKVIVSHRSGETNDDFIIDLALGSGADGIKTGAPARGERIAKFNRLLQMQREELN